MNKNQNNIKNDNCLNSIPFNIIGIFIIIFESISLIMSILCLVLTSWNFLKHFIKILNIISLAIISLIIIINTILFIKIKNNRYDIRKNYNNRMCISLLLFLLYIIIIIFNIYNSIYLSIRLHIADFPEYGGRKRDQNYIDNHPNEFGFIPLKQFIIVGLCPSVISVLNLVCFILCFVFRKKMILTYNNMLFSVDNNEINEVKIVQKNRNNHKHINRNRKIRKYSIDLRNNTNDIIIRNNNTDPNMERNGKNIKEDKNYIKLKLNNSDDGEEYIKKDNNKNYINNILDTKETLNEKNKEKAKELNFNHINSMRGTKSSMSDQDK